MDPLIFDPLLKRIRWGGRRLGTMLGKPIGSETDYAESWEIADQQDGQSVVAAGPFAGAKLTDLVHNQAAELLGQHASLTQFPLLIKFLDANDWLSLQVHPNDLQAKGYNPRENGKTEAWVILHAEPDSQICAGLKKGVTREQFAQALADGTVEETLHIIPATTGDCIFVPAGTVHALGPGILLAEVQQQSNLTFRLHDWGRLGADGKPREIHVEQSLACTDFERGPLEPVRPVLLQDDGNRLEELVSCEYFVIRRHIITEPCLLNMESHFRVVMVLDGHGSLTTGATSVPCSPGQTVLLPAAAEEAVAKPEDSMTLIEVFPP